MATKRSTLHVFIIILLLSMSVPTGVKAEDDLYRPMQQEETSGMTPFQEALQQAVAERVAAGEPVPASVEYDLQVAPEEPAPMMRNFSAEPQEQSMLVTATTALLFENPQQAGYEEWPALVVEEDGEEVDYSYIYYADVAEADPEFWNTYEFGQEPRVQTYVETYEITFPSEEFLNVLETDTLTGSSNSGAILMGFTYTGPKIDYSFQESADVCIPAIPNNLFPWISDWTDPDGDGCVSVIPIYSLNAGFRLDWALGLRLPVGVTLSGPAELELGTSQYLSATLNPLDWSEEDFTKAGVDSREGNEFLLELDYFFGVDLSIGGYEYCPLPAPLGCFSQLNFPDASKNFVTPFGTGETFDLVNLDASVFEWGLSDLIKGGQDKDDDNNNEGSDTDDSDDENSDDDDGSDELLDGIFSVDLGLRMIPNLGSSRITAHWEAVPGSDCAGSGDVTFTEKNVAVPIGPITPCDLGDTNNKAKVSLSDFHYWFNQFSISLGAYLQLNLFNGDLPEIYIPLTNVDIAKLMGNPSIGYLGRHRQCSTLLAAFDLTSGPLDQVLNALLQCSDTGPANYVELSMPVVDKTPPVSTLGFAGSVGDNGWYVSDVEVSLNVADNSLACTGMTTGAEYSFDGVQWVPYTVPFTVSDQGTTTIYHRAWDAVGNMEEVRSDNLKIDKAPPVLTGSVTPKPNSYGWNNSDVTVHFAASDVTSGVAAVTPDQILTLEGAGQSVTGSAKDNAGNEAKLTMNGINIDKTKPELLITSPQAGSYPNTSSFTAAWTATDALSGIASQAGTLGGVNVQNGETVNLLLVSAGAHTFTVQVVDKADNGAQDDVQLNITTDINGLTDATNYICRLGWINKAGVCNSLTSKLNAAKNSIQRGKNETAINQLQAFINELDAQKGKAVNLSGYELLKADALYVIEQWKK